MIAFSFSDGGNRCENLDLFSTINCQNDMFGMVIMDGYSCSEGSMEFLSDRLGECVFSGDLDKNIIEPCKSVSVKAAVCFLFKDETHLHIYNAGDCRVYNKSGALLTEDNSVAWRSLKEMGVDNKKIPHLVCYCPDRN
ncbi:PP2C family serine/threonine-protein phosphatase, partial [Klebsiella oxytoca]|uniref:PP2C family serine/threonine-protein phosphatase n=1 Tax=Klebsiella oxytoca TaxID=571 RepID=UPI00195BA396